jgi:hypothetical protein
MFDGDKPVLLVPLPNSGGTERMDLTSIYDAQRRLPEIANTNEHTSPNLLAVFNKAYLDAGAMHKRLHLILVDAAQVANKRKGRVILELAPAKLQELGLVNSKNKAGSADLRQAVLDMDDEYLTAMRHVAEIEAMVSFMSEKKRGFEMAYGSVKAIVGGGDNKPFKRNPNLSTGLTGDRPNGPRGGFGGGGF